MKKWMLGITSTALFFFTAAVTPVSATLLTYQDEGNSPSLLADVNQTTAAVSNIRYTLPGLVGIEFDAGGTLYGLTSSLNSLYPSLYSIDPVTGTASFIGKTGLDNVLEGDLAFDPITNTLWGAYQLHTPNLDFFTLNTTTGAATFAFGLTASNTDYSAMAFDNTGNLYILDTQSTTQDSLLKVDKTNGTILDKLLLTDSGNLANLGGSAGMDFDPVTGYMYVTDSGTKVLYTLDTATGVLSFIAVSTIGDNLAGLTVVPAQNVPEPATLLLFGAGLLGFALAKRKS